MVACSIAVTARMNFRMIALLSRWVSLPSDTLAPAAFHLPAQPPVSPGTHGHDGRTNLSSE